MAQIGSTRALFGYVNGHGVLLERLLQTPEVPVVGYAMTEQAYAQITPETGMYYALFDTATGTEINFVEVLTHAEWIVTTPQPTTLYIITDQGGIIVEVEYGTTPVDLVYIGTTEYWSRYERIVSKSLSDTYRSVSYQTIWDAAKNAVGMTSDYWYLQPLPNSYDYNGKPQFRVYKFYSDPGTVKFSNKYSGDNTLWVSDSSYYRQYVSFVRWNSRLSAWEFASASTTTDKTVLGDYDFTFLDGEIVTTVPLVVPYEGTKFVPAT